MNLKDIRTISKLIIRELHCTTCNTRKFIVVNENYNAYNLDVVSKCCDHPDYRL